MSPHEYVGAFCVFVELLGASCAALVRLVCVFVGGGK